MVTDEGSERDARLASLEAALTAGARLYHEVAACLTAELGVEDAKQRLAGALRACGRWRGEALAGLLPEDASARDITENWDSADLRLPIEKGYPGGGFRPGGNVAEISIVESAEWQAWRDIEDKALVRLYYVEMLAGIAEGYGRGLMIEHPKFGPNLKSLWTVRFTTPDRPADRGPLEVEALEDAAASTALLAGTRRAVAGLAYFLGRTVVEA